MQDFISTLAQGYFIAFISNFLIFAGAYVIFWILFSKNFTKLRIQLVQRSNSEQVREEIKNQFISLLVLALYISAMIILGKYGITKTYTDINLHGGLLYAIITFILIIVVDDTWFYWSHRFMHHPKIYKYVHALHHKSLDVNPFSGFSFHVWN